MLLFLSTCATELQNVTDMLRVKRLTFCNSDVLGRPINKFLGNFSQGGGGGVFARGESGKIRPKGGGGSPNYVIMLIFCLYAFRAYSVKTYSTLGN